MLHPYDIMTAEALLDLDKLVEQANDNSTTPATKEPEFTDFAEWIKS